MVRRTIDQLSSVPLSLVYIAGHVIEAETAERILTEAGITYTLRLEPFVTTSVLNSREHMGVFLYVPTALHQQCREMLQSRGVKDTIELADVQPSEGTDGA